MKKVFKACAALALTAGLALSMAAFAACSGDEADLTLISGDFTNEATSEQLAELESKISAENTAGLYGDTSVEGWSYNARMAVLSDIDMQIKMSYGGQSFSMNMGIDVDMDHTISFYNEGEGVDFRGSGNTEMSMSIPMLTSSGSVTNVNAGYSGKSYNDTDYFYINGTVTAYDDSQSYTESAKIKMALADAVDGGIVIDTDDIVGSLVEMDMIRDAINTDGVTVYVDDSSEDTLKIKVSYSKASYINAFYDELEDTMESMGVTGLTYDNLYNGVTFRYMDYYLEFDNTTGVLVGCGSKLDASFDIDLVIDGVSTNYTFDMDIDSWVVSTDTAAEELPSDLSDYVLY